MWPTSVPGNFCFECRQRAESSWGPTANFLLWSVRFVPRLLGRFFSVRFQFSAAPLNLRGNPVITVSGKVLPERTGLDGRAVAHSGGEGVRQGMLLNGKPGTSQSRLYFSCVLALAGKDGVAGSGTEGTRSPEKALSLQIAVSNCIFPYSRNHALRFPFFCSDHIFFHTFFFEEGCLMRWWGAYGRHRPPERGRVLRLVLL